MHPTFAVLKMLYGVCTVLTSLFVWFVIKSCLYRLYFYYIFPTILHYKDYPYEIQPFIIRCNRLEKQYGAICEYISSVYYHQLWLLNANWNK